MDRGEFQQDSVLKQLEVLKEEEKEFQNLKVSQTLGTWPPSVPSPTGRCGPRWFAPQGAGHPSLCLPQGRTSSSLAQHCFFQAFCPRATSPAVARTRGLSLHKEGCSDTLGALLWSQHPFGGLKKNVCQDSGVQGAPIPPSDLERAERDALVA